jgi:hypothetical protein
MSAVLKVTEWISEPPTKPVPKLMKVTVTTNTKQRFEYIRAFTSSFAAYDWVLDRHPHCDRVEVEPVQSEPADPAGREGRHA